MSTRTIVIVAATLSMATIAHADGPLASTASSGVEYPVFKTGGWLALPFSSTGGGLTLRAADLDKGGNSSTGLVNNTGVRYLFPGESIGFYVAGESSDLWMPTTSSTMTKPTETAIGYDHVLLRLVLRDRTLKSIDDKILTECSNTPLDTPCTAESWRSRRRELTPTRIGIGVRGSSPHQTAQAAEGVDTNGWALSLEAYVDITLRSESLFASASITHMNGWESATDTGARTANQATVTIGGYYQIADPTRIGLEIQTLDQWSDFPERKGIAATIFATYRAKDQVSLMAAILFEQRPAFDDETNTTRVQIFLGPQISL